jgi:transcription initiation factor TFIID subunit 6
MSDPTGGVADGGNDRVSPESIKIIAQTVGIEALPDEVARALAPDVEYRLREVIQDALKFARHSKRSAISTEDVNASLRLRDVEPLYGFPAGAGPVPFREVPGQPELFFQEQKELQLKDVLAAKLPRPPVAVNVVPHWLAVEGVQPVIPENPNPDPERARAGVGAGADAPRARDFRAPVAPDDVVAPVGTAPRAPRDAGDASGSQPGVVVEPTLTHELSKELQLYFDRVTATVRGGGVGPEAPVLRAALESLQTDNGIHQLVPYFVRFAQEEVATSLKNLPRLTAVIAAVRALVSNPHVHVELYLHQLMPSVVTCLVAKKLGGEPSDLDDHCFAPRARGGDHGAGMRQVWRAVPDDPAAHHAHARESAPRPNEASRHALRRRGRPRRARAEGHAPAHPAAPKAGARNARAHARGGRGGVENGLENGRRQVGGEGAPAKARRGARARRAETRRRGVSARGARRALGGGERGERARAASRAKKQKRSVHSVRECGSSIVGERAPGRLRVGKSERRPGRFAWTSPARRRRSPSATRFCRTRARTRRRWRRRWLLRRRS